MKTNLDKKIQTAEDKLSTTLNQAYGINFDQPVVRDQAAFRILFQNVKDWLSSTWPGKDASSSIIDLVTSYFHDKESIFESRLTTELTTAVNDKTFTEMKTFLNELAAAIAYEKVKRKLLTRLLDTSIDS